MNMLALFLASFTLAAVAFLVNRDPLYLYSAFGLHASAYLLLTTPTIVSNRFLRILRSLPCAYLLLLSVGAVATGTYFLANRQVHYRADFLTGNANLLAAGLVLAHLSCCTLTRRPWLRLLICVVTLPALVFTGSRTSLAVFALLTPFVFFLDQRPTFKHIGTTSAIVIAFILLIAALPTLASRNTNRPDSTNLLVSSDDYRHSAWNKSRAKEVTLAPTTERGPSADGNVTRLTATSRPEVSSGLVIYQSIRIPNSTDHYTASVFLRADSPQTIILSANSSATKCPASTEWSRCVTPPSPINSRGQIQFQIRTESPGESVTVYLWGAQLEVGSQATLPTHTSLPIRTQLWNISALQRITVSSISNTSSWTARQEAFRIAWAMFLDRPIGGNGMTGLRVAQGIQLGAGTVEPGGDDVPPHSHNLLLQLLLEGGLLGLASYLIPFTYTILAFPTRHRGRVYLLAVAAILLNIMDYTYFNNSFYYLYWLTVGLLRQSSSNATFN